MKKQPWTGYEKAYRIRFEILWRNFEHTFNSKKTWNAFEFAESFFLVNRNLILNDFEGALLDPQAFVKNELEEKDFWILSHIDDEDEDIAQFFVEYAEVGAFEEWQVRYYCQKLISKGEPLPPPLAKFVCKILEMERIGPTIYSQKSAYDIQNRNFFLSCIMYYMITLFNLRPYAGDLDKAYKVRPRGGVGVIYEAIKDLDKETIAVKYKNKIKKENILVQNFSINSYETVRFAWTLWQPFFKQYINPSL